MATGEKKTYPEKTGTRKSNNWFQLFALREARRKNGRGEGLEANIKWKEKKMNFRRLLP